MSRHAIVLAAGAGRRFGGGKLLASWRGEPLVRWSVRAALEARVETVTVVLGSHPDDVSRALEPLTDPRLRTIVADDWAIGLSASLRAGLSVLPRGEASVCILLADMPCIPQGLVDALLDSVEAGATAARPVHTDGPAHPVAFGAAAFSALASLQGDQGARAVLEALGSEVAFLPSTNPGVVFDVDHPSDLETD